MKKLLLSLTLLCASLAYGQRDPKMDAFIDDLMSKMTLDEKLGQLNLASGGVPGGFRHFSPAKGPGGAIFFDGGLRICYNGKTIVTRRRFRRPVRRDPLCDIFGASPPCSWP